MPQIQLEAAPAFSLIACINCFNFNKKGQLTAKQKQNNNVAQLAWPESINQCEKTQPGDCLVAFLVCVINILCTHITDTDTDLPSYRYRYSAADTDTIVLTSPTTIDICCLPLSSGFVFCLFLPTPD